MNDKLVFSHKNNFTNIRAFIMTTYFIVITITILILILLIGFSANSIDLYIQIIECFILFHITFTCMINDIFNKSEFIFDDNKISYIRKPPITADFLIKITIENNEINIVQKVNKINESNNNIYYMHVKYEFDMHQYYPIVYNITVNNNNQIIYENNIDYFTTLYFKDANNITIESINDFLTITIDHIIQKIINHR